MKYFELKDDGTVIIREKRRTGNGPRDRVFWQIISARELTEEEIMEVISYRFPTQGYGPSDYAKYNYTTSDYSKIYSVEVISNASCD